MNRDKVYKAIKQNDHICLATLIKNIKSAELDCMETIDGNKTSFIHEAAKQNSPEIIDLLSKAGAELNLGDNNDFIPLFHAVKNNNLKVVRTLINNGANAHKKDLKGRTPLCYAADPDVVLLLLDNGADIEARDNDGNTPLRIAIQEEYIKAAQRLIFCGADMHAMNNNDYCPIHACKNEKILQILIDNGADVNIKDHMGNTILHHYAYSNHNLATILLNNGINVDCNAKNNSSETPLYYICDSDKDDPGLIPLLLEKRADIEAKNSGGKTPLYAALKRGNIKTFLTLLKYGADINITNNNGDTLMHEIASKWNSSEVFFHILMDRKMPLLKNNSGLTPLHRAARADNTDNIKILLDYGADIHEKDFNGLTPLHHAAEIGREKAVKFLLKKGADINNVNEYGKTPLAMAVSYNEDKMVKLLLKNGADFKIKDKWNRTLLYVVLDNKNTKLAKFLLEQGIDCNERCENGRTALHAAASRGDLKMIKLLIEHGADINAQDDKLMTPLMIAADYHKPEAMVCLLSYDNIDVNLKNYLNRNILAFLDDIEYDINITRKILKKGADTSVPIFSGTVLYECAKKSAKLTKLLLKFGADPNLGPYLPLSNAIYGRNIESMKLLLDNGANPNLTESSEPIIHTAIHNSDINAIKLLLAYGAEVDTKNQHGETALNCAASHRDKDILELLLEYGADINSVNNKGLTALNHAAANNTIDVVKFLLEKGAEVPVKSIIHNASCNRSAEITKLFIKMGMDPDSINKQGMKPLHCAVQNGSIENVKLLLKYTDVNEFYSGSTYYNGYYNDYEDPYFPKADIYKSTALLDAARENHVSIAKILLKEGADISAVDNYGYNVLARSSFHSDCDGYHDNNFAMINLLLKHAQKIGVFNKLLEQKDNCNRTALQRLKRSESGWYKKFGKKWGI